MKNKVFKKGDRTNIPRHISNCAFYYHYDYNGDTETVITINRKRKNAYRQFINYYYKLYTKNKYE